MMKSIAIYILRACMNLVYAVMKLRVTRPGKIVFLSRQSNEVPLDFRMTQDELLEREPWLQIVNICSRLEVEEKTDSDSGESRLSGLVEFAKATLKSMWEMSNAGIVVLDAYWPAVSVLKHKSGLTVIQMWHALGKIKKSGYQTLGKESGRSEKLARLMKMHKGYDFIIAGGKAWNQFYRASFGEDDYTLVNCGLPRIDYLLMTRDENRKAVFEAYPEFAGKKIILYAPTFRRNIEYDWEKLTECVPEDAVLIVKGHPNQTLRLKDDADGEKSRGNVYTCPDFKAVELLAASDYLITDYSAIAIEGAVLSVRTLYYVCDYEEYRSKNGMNIDLFEEMPGCVFRDAEELMDVIRNDAYPDEALKSYRERFLPEEPGTSAAKIADLIISRIPE